MLNVNQTLVLLVVLILLYLITLPASYKITENIMGTPDMSPIEEPADFSDFWYRPYGLNMYTNFPFWNTQIGTTRNMSYDLRGDIPIPRGQTGPWLNSSREGPIMNRPLMS